MMNILVVNIPARVSLSSLDSCSEKAEIVRQLYVILQNKFIVKMSIFSPTRLHLYLITVDIFHHLLYTSLLLKKSIFNETTYKSVSTNLPIKFLPEVCLEVLPIEFDM